MEKLKIKTTFLPEAPGCYLMYDKDGVVIYIGKAKNIKNRVKSYFTGAHNLKTTMLVKEIVDFSFVQTKTELEALILELNLIKKHLPKYNVKLTDDASYPYILITDEEHPRILVQRDFDKSKGAYYGPYPNVYNARETVKLLNKMFPLRKCESIPNKACLYYHMNECLAPCISKEKLDYSKYLKEIKAFLKGDIKDVVKELESKMFQASDNLNFERALEYKNLISAIKETTEKQIISLNDFKDRDFIAYYETIEEISIQIMLMRNGKIIDSKGTIIAKLIDVEEQIFSYLLQFYDKNIIPDELYFSDKFNLENLQLIFNKSKIFIPQKGDKKKIIDLAYENAKYDLKHYVLLKTSQEAKKQEAVNQFKDMLGLQNIKRIEAFDNSHLFGAGPISAMVVYEESQPLYKQFRKFHLKTTTSDDYKAFEEVIYRRYQRLLVEQSSLPNLIIVDGAKGQVNATIKTLNSLGLAIPVVGLKKNDRHSLESIVYNNLDFQLEKGSDLYVFLSSISERMHEFAVNFHRKTRTKTMYKSHLDNIKGVGPKRKEKLLQKFVTLDNIIIGSVSEFQEIGINEELRNTIIKHLQERVQDEKKN